MHIPSHLVSDPVNGACAALALAALTYGVRKIKREDVPMMAASGAFVFAAQMLNFPIGGGTSGHFLGAAAVAALLGPWSALVVMAAVLAVQAFLFGDGGVEALGSNLVNMGIVGGVFMFPLMNKIRALLPQGRAGKLTSVAVASWVSVVAASSLCAVELALSGASPLGVALPAMLEKHVFIGFGEALIAVAFIAWVYPALSGAKVRTKRLATGTLLIALALAGIASPLASSSPDGLEKVAAEKGFLETAETSVWSAAPFSEYAVPSVTSDALSTGIAGLIGTLSVFGFSLGFAGLPRRRE